MNISKPSGLGKLLRNAALVVACVGSFAACNNKTIVVREELRGVLMAGEAPGKKGVEPKSINPLKNTEDARGKKLSPSWNPLLGRPCFKGARSQMPKLPKGCQYRCAEGRIAVKCSS